MTGSTACMPWKTPLRLMSITWPQASGSAASIRATGSMAPALLIRMSTVPKASTAAVTAASTSQ
jgi:hypothetical protein